MAISIAHLGPTGTNAETAALAYRRLLAQKPGVDCCLRPYPSIAQTIRSVAEEQVDLAVVPVENSTEGSLAVTLDALWELDCLRVQQELVLPIAHTLLCRGVSLKGIKTVYSHPQALAQCQKWLGQFLPEARQVATNSTTEALQSLNQDPTAAAIASPRAAQLYDLPAIASDINDYPDNCTRFWVLGLTPSWEGSRTSLAFSLPANVPGALVQPLQVFAQAGINLSRIESRPTKRSLGEYLFFIDLEGSGTRSPVREALAQLSAYVEVLKIFGSYDAIRIEPSDLPGF